MSARSLHEVFAAGEPAWPVVQSWILAAKNPVEILVPDETQREQVLLDTQITLRSPRGRSSITPADYSLAGYEFLVRAAKNSLGPCLPGIEGARTTRRAVLAAFGW